MSAPTVYFLHVPKTSGTAALLYLRAHFTPHEVLHGCRIAELDRLTTDELYGFALVRSEGGPGLLGRMPANTQVVTLLRDPFDRAVSHWRHVRRDVDHPKHRPIGGTAAPFGAFLAVIGPNPIARFLAVADDAGACSLWDTPSGQATVPDLLERAVARLESCAVVGLAEYHEESMALIAHRFGWAPPTELPRVNVADAVGSAECAIAAAERTRFEDENEVDRALYDHAVSLFERRCRLHSSEARRDQYEQRLARAAMDLDARLDIDLLAAAPGSGWFPPVMSEMGMIRPIGNGGLATIDLPVRLPRFVKLEVDCPVAAGGIDGLTVTVNGEAVALQPHVVGDVVTLHGVVPPAQAPQPFTRLTLSAARAERMRFGPTQSRSEAAMSFGIRGVSLVPYAPARLHATARLDMAPKPAPIDAAAHNREASVFLSSSPTWVMDHDVQCRLVELGLWENAVELQRDGYTVVRDVVDPRMIERLRSLIVRHAEPAVLKTRQSQVALPMRFDPIFSEALLLPAQLALADFVCGKAMLDGMSGLVRDRSSHPSALHAENGMWLPAPYPRHNFVVSSMLTCDDFDERTGGTCFVPGSHLTALNPTQADADELVGAVPAIAPAGSLILWLGGTWHGSSQRRVPGERVSLLTIFTRPQLRATQDIASLPDELVDSDELRLRLRRLDLYGRKGWAIPGDPNALIRWIRALPLDERSLTCDWGESFETTFVARPAAGTGFE